jgi:hypothetical protein
VRSSLYLAVQASTCARIYSGCDRASWLGGCGQTLSMGVLLLASTWRGKEAPEGIRRRSNWNRDPTVTARICLNHMNVVFTVSLDPLMPIPTSSASSRMLATWFISNGENFFFEVRALVLPDSSTACNAYARAYCPTKPTTGNRS